MHTEYNSAALAELAQRHQWLLWSSYPVQGKAKPTKKPRNPRTGHQDDSNVNPENWVSGQEVIEAQELFEADGVGFAVTKEDPYSLIDGDEWLPDGKTLTPYGQYIVDLVDSYFEISPNGHGLRGIVKGKLDSNLGADIKGDGENRLEIKSFGGFMTITGNHWPGSQDTIKERQAELEAIASEARERRRAARGTPERHSAGTQRMSSTGDTPYGLAALYAECQDVATTPEGSRNTQLNLSAFRLGQLVGGGELTQPTAEEELRKAAHYCGLGAREAEATIQSGLGDGMLQPRGGPAPDEPQLHHATEDDSDLDELTFEQAKGMIIALRKEKQHLQQQLSWWDDIMSNPNVKAVQRLMIKHFMTLERTAPPKIIDGESWYRIDTEACGKAIGGDKGTVSRNLPALEAGGVIELKEVPWTAPNGYENHLLFYHLTGAESAPAAITLPNKGRTPKQCVTCGAEVQVKHRWVQRQEITFCPHCQVKKVYPIEERFALPVGEIHYTPQLHHATENSEEEEQAPATENADATQPMVSNVASLSLVEDTQTFAPVASCNWQLGQQTDKGTIVEVFPDLRRVRVKINPYLYANYLYEQVTPLQL